MNLLLAGPVVLPLLGAALCIGAGRSRNAQRVIAVLTLTAVAVLSAVLLLRVDDEGTVAVQVGGWEAPVGITLVADRLAAIMLVLAVLMLLAVLVYAIGQPGAEEDHVGFHPVYLVLAAGVALAFLTGDLFNLFVAFEVLLMHSVEPNGGDRLVVVAVEHSGIGFHADRGVDPGTVLTRVKDGNVVVRTGDED